MTVPGGFPARGLWRRPGLRWADVVVVAALLALLFGLLRLAPALNAPFLPKTAPSAVSTDPANLPYYAVRSLLRMFIALILSVLFTFVYATAAARLRRTEKVLIPLLDILQSVPVLGFLTITVTLFIGLFPVSDAFNHRIEFHGTGNFRDHNVVKRIPGANHFALDYLLPVLDIQRGAVRYIVGDQQPVVLHIHDPHLTGTANDDWLLFAVIVLG